MLFEAVFIDIAFHEDKEILREDYLKLSNGSKSLSPIWLLLSVTLDRLY